MQISFTCESCGTEMEADSSLFGRSSTCPTCSTSIQVPQGKVAPGTTLGGFEIEGTLGKGAMGEVFLAKQLAMDRQVALKVLPAHFSEDEERVDRFLHEARMSAKLDHPNIVTVLDAGVDTGYYYLAMQYVQGETLEDRMKRFGRLEEKEVLNCGIKIAAGLQRAWDRHQMLHRDIKPANIMMDEFGEPKLLDMGLAKTLLEDRKITVTGMIVGTPLYMSPEQGKGGQMDCRADIYSLGATLYTLLTGSPPYQADSVVAILAKHAFDPFPDPRRRNRELSEGCAKLLERMMGKEPEERFQDWAEVVAAMKAVRAGRSLGSGPPMGQTTLAKRATAAVSPSARVGSQYDATVAMGPGPLDDTQQTQRKSKAPWLIAIVGGLGIGAVAAIAALAMIIGGGGDSAGSGDPPPDQPGPVAATPGSQPASPTSTPAINPAPWPEVPRTPADDAAAEQLAELTDSTDDLLAQYPERHDDVIGVYESLLPDALGSPLEAQIESRLNDLQNSRSAAVDATWERLRQEAEAAAAAGRAQDAVQALRAYAGPWAAATAARRHELADSLDSVAADTQGSTGPSPELQRRMLDTDLGRAMLGGDLDRAARLLDAAIANDDLAGQRAELRAMRGTVRDLQALPAKLMASYPTGEPVSIHFTSGRAERQISAIDGDQAKARVVVQETTQDGRTYAGMLGNGDFSWADLHVDERLALLKKVDPPLRDLAVGLLAVQVNEVAAAERFLGTAAADLPLAQLADAARQDLTGDGRNQSARDDVKSMLAGIRLPMYEPFQIRDVTAGKTLSARQRQDLITQLQHFQRNYSDTQVARDYAGILSMLAGLTRAPGRTIPYLVPRAVNSADFTSDAQLTPATQRTVAEQEALPVEVVNRHGIHFRLVPKGLDGRAPSPDRSFYLSVYEITEAQWERVTGERRGSGREDYPVQDLRPTEMPDFIKALNRADGYERGELTYRLPTLREWQYACLAGSEDAFYFDGGLSRLADFANHLDASAPTRIGDWTAAGQRGPRSDRQATLAPGGSYPANPLGLYDLVGNVAEYVIDTPNFPAPGSDAPTFHAIASGVQDGSLIHLIGGNWFMPPGDCLPDASVPILQAREQLSAPHLAGVGLRILMEVGDLEPLPEAPKISPRTTDSGPALTGPGGNRLPRPGDFENDNFSGGALPPPPPLDRRRPPNNRR